MKSLLDRISDKVLIGDECWIWTGSHTVDGYGNLRAESGKTVRAHRAVYELLVGPVPEGLMLDHLCRQRDCVKPSHLEPVTNAENVRRGEAGGKPKTECLNGHPFNEINTYIHPTKGSKECRPCRAARARRASNRKQAT